MRLTILIFALLCTETHACLVPGTSLSLDSGKQQNYGFKISAHPDQFCKTCTLLEIDAPNTYGELYLSSFSYRVHNEAGSIVDISIPISQDTSTTKLTLLAHTKTVHYFSFGYDLDGAYCTKHVFTFNHKVN